MMGDGEVYSAAVAVLHRTGRSSDRSVPRRRRIDLERPGVDATGHVLGAREAPLSQEARDAQAATAMVAVDDDAARTMRFEQVESCGDLSHRHEDRPGDVRRRMLVGLTAVEEQEAFARRPQGRDGVDVEFERKLGGGILTGHRLAGSGRHPVEPNKPRHGPFRAPA